MLSSPEFYDLVITSPESPRTGEGSMLELADGRIMFVYTDFRGGEDNARASIVKRLSDDAGATWSEPEVIIADEGRENVMSTSLIRLQSGEILLAYLRKDSRSECHICLRRSEDEGSTWSEPIVCNARVSYFVIVNDCFLQLSDGRLVLPFEVCEEVWVPNERIEAGCLYSDDDGHTWQMSNTIYAPKRGAMEARVVELGDGRLWMLMRTDQGVIYEAYSSDRGESWGEPAPTAIESPQSPFVFTRIPSTGDILLVRNPVANMTQGTHQGYRTPLSACISDDDGLTWKHEKLLEANTAHTYCYLSVCFVDDIAVFSYYVGSPEQPLESLRIARVPVSWFYEPASGADVSE